MIIPPKSLDVALNIKANEPLFVRKLSE